MRIKRHPGMPFKKKLAGLICINCSKNNCVISLPFYETANVSELLWNSIFTNMSSQN